jgi:cysteine desulfurase/selenocysteine lyase
MSGIVEETEVINHETCLKDFPMLSRVIDDNPVIYLDSAATSLKPVQVASEISRYYLEVSANIHRGKHYLSEEASVFYEEGRYKVAQFIGAAGNEVVFVRNTTEALNVVAKGLDLSKDDTVLVCTDSHHSGYLPWLDKANVEFVHISTQGVVDLDYYEELLKGSPKVVSLTHCSNVSGLYAPIEKMAQMAKNVGAIVVVDAAQSIPHRRLNVNRQNIDFLAFSGHKMLGPTGIGVLYGRQQYLEKLKPTYLGGGMVDWVDTAGYRSRKIPHKFEAGTPHIAGVYGLVAAIKYLERIGFERIEKHDLALGKVLLHEALKRDYIEVIAPGNETTERCAIVSIKMKQQSSLGDVARMLSDSYGIMCRTGHMCAQPLVDSLANGEILRASAYLYNTKEDVQAFFQALDEIQSALHH